MNNVENLWKNLCEKLSKITEKVWWKSGLGFKSDYLMRKNWSFAWVFKLFYTEFYRIILEVFYLENSEFCTVSTVPNTITNI